MLVRTISALLLAPAAILIAVYASPPAFLIVLGVLGTLCLYEYFQIAVHMGLSPQPWFGYAAFWLLFVSWQNPWLPPLASLTAILLAAFLSAMWRRDPIHQRAVGLMANVLGVLYIALFLSPAYRLRYEFGNTLGLHWLIVLFAVIWTGDIAALLIGRKLGRTLFSRQLSPKKTNEGAIGGLVAGIAVAVLLRYFLFTELPLVHVITTSILLGVFGQMGDLAESMLKRAAQVKDSSNLIPGHGGILDRIDSLLFAFPVLYLYLLQLYAPR